MPRAYLTQDDKPNLLLLGKIADYKTRYNLDNAALAKGLGMANTTFCRRMDNPSTFTLGELRQLRQRLKIPKEEMPLPGDELKSSNDESKSSNDESKTPRSITMDDLADLLQRTIRLTVEMLLLGDE